MKKYLVLAAIALAMVPVVGCVTTPEPVIQSNEMALRLLQDAKVRGETAIDAFVTETVGLNNERYAKEFERVEMVLLDEQGNTGLVDLTRYKALGAAYAEEMSKGEVYYRARGEQLKQAISAPLVLSAGLLSANGEYLQAAGISDELFNSLLNSSVALGEQLKTSYDQYKVEKEAQDAIDNAERDAEREAARQRSKADLTELINLFRTNGQPPAAGGTTNE